VIFPAAGVFLTEIKLIPYNKIMNKMIFLWLVGFVCLQFLSAAEDQNRIGLQLGEKHKSLNFKYRQFLNMTAYISGSEEQKTFLELNNDRDREVYIDLFWKMRNPSPGSKTNEYQQKIHERFAYVNKYFGRGTYQEGWQTDKGRIYMILGKPSSIETFDSEPGLYPAEVWYYYAETDSSLPHYFNITFYKKYGSGEWVLYDPVAHGPAALLVNGDLSSLVDYKTIYQEIKRLAPGLAGPAVSMIPGQTPMYFKPSLSNHRIMADIFDFPYKKINTRYASNFLNYKGYVTVESSIKYIESSYRVSVAKDSWNFGQVLYSVKPKKLSMDYNPDKDTYYFNFEVITSLKKNETVIYQDTRNYDYNLNKQNIDVFRSGGVVIHHSFPVIPGSYTLAVFLENKVSNEFSYFETKIDINDSIAPNLAEPILGFGLEKDSTNYSYAYKFNDFKLRVDTEQNFSHHESIYLLLPVHNLTEDLREQGTIEVSVKANNPANDYLWSESIPLKEFPVRQTATILKTVSLPGLKSDDYDLTVTLNDPQHQVADTKKTAFSISPMKIARPTEMYDKRIMKNSFYTDYLIGLQYLNIKNNELAESFLEKSVRLNPDFNEALLAFLNVKLLLRKFNQVLDHVEKLKPYEKFRFNYHEAKGKALFGLEKYQEALAELSAANAIYNRNYGVINLIGRSFLKLNNSSQAVNAFEASLELYEDQPAIKEMLTDLKKK
jgi:GWxTD domain-containing protein